MRSTIQERADRSIREGEHKSKSVVDELKARHDQELQLTLNTVRQGIKNLEDRSVTCPDGLVPQ